MRGHSNLYVGTVAQTIVSAISEFVHAGDTKSWAFGMDTNVTRLSFRK